MKNEQNEGRSIPLSEAGVNQLSAALGAVTLQLEGDPSRTSPLTHAPAPIYLSEGRGGRERAFFWVLKGDSSALTGLGLDFDRKG